MLDRKQCNRIAWALLFVGCIGCIGCIGCGASEENDGNGGVDGVGNQEKAVSDSAESILPQSVAATDIVSVATEEELNNYLANFDDAVWHRFERSLGELAGTWKESGRGGHQMIFDAKHEAGTYLDGPAGNMVTARFAISDSGVLVTFLKRDGVGFGTHYKLDRETLTGPKGPNPAAIWKRQNLTQAKPNSK